LLKAPSELTSMSKDFAVYRYGRAENPASYAWARYSMDKSNVSVGSSIELLGIGAEELSSPTLGFLVPPYFDRVQFKVMLSPTTFEHVAVFTEDDSINHKGPDLFAPSENTILLHMERDWLKCSPAEAQRKLKAAVQRVKPKWDLTYKEFWRVIMRRNHSFRPVSKDLRTFETPFYAVYAVDVPPRDVDKVCLFFKVYDGKSLKYISKRFAAGTETLRQILRGYDLHKYALYEEVHSRRLDPIETFDMTVASMELGSGDMIVLCPRGLEQQLHAHYQSLVYTSNLVTVHPNMWHS